MEEIKKISVWLLIIIMIRSDKLKRFVKRNKIYIFLVLTCPGILWIFIHQNLLLSEWNNAPTYIKNHTSSVFSEEKLVKVGIVRWQDLDRGQMKVFSRVFYNRLYLAADEFFSYTSYFSPRFYFQAGDGSSLSPPGVEPVPVILYPLALSGLLVLIKRKKRTLIFLTLLFSVFAFLIGERKMSFLWPMLLFLIFLAYLKIESMNKVYKTIVIIFLFFYSVFLGGRMIWLSH